MSNGTEQNLHPDALGNRNSWGRRHGATVLLGIFALLTLLPILYEVLSH